MRSLRRCQQPRHPGRHAWHPGRLAGRTRAHCTMRRAPHLGRHQHDVDVLAEVHAVVLHDAQQEAVGQAQGGARLHGRQDPGVQLGLRARAEGGGGWRRGAASRGAVGQRLVGAGPATIAARSARGRGARARRCSCLPSGSIGARQATPPSSGGPPTATDAAPRRPGPVAARARAAARRARGRRHAIAAAAREAARPERARCAAARSASRSRCERHAAAPGAGPRDQRPRPRGALQLLARISPARRRR
jgi:hypothetical protein